jgi:hypothetical protein
LAQASSLHSFQPTDGSLVALPAQTPHSLAFLDFAETTETVAFLLAFVPSSNESARGEIKVKFFFPALSLFSLLLLLLS